MEKEEGKKGEKNIYIKKRKEKKNTIGKKNRIKKVPAVPKIIY